jgi:hypothetical protein
MVEAERAHKAEGRSADIAAARDRFYKADIAAEVVAFLGRHQTPFEIADSAEFFARTDEPAVTTSRGYEATIILLAARGRRCWRRSVAGSPLGEPLAKPNDLC